MQTVDILLGNSEGLLSDFLQNLIQDTCGEHCLVCCTRAVRLEQFMLYAVSRRFDLAVMIPNNLPAEPSGLASLNAFGEACHALRHLQRRAVLPILAIGAFDQPAEQKAALLAAGARCALDLPFVPGEVQAAIRDALGLVKTSRPTESDWSLADTLMRGVHGGPEALAVKNAA